MINGVAFEGGGIKVVSFLGYMDGLSRSSISTFMLDNIDYISGTSAGSIIGLSIALRINPNETFDILKNFLKKEYRKPSKVSGILRLPIKYGMFDVETLLGRLIFDLFEYANINPDITFLDFYELSGIDFRVTATNLTNNTLKVFSYRDNVKITDAIYASCSFPLVFNPRYIKNEMYSDGGILNNYPVDVFTDVEDNITMMGLRVDKVSEVHSYTPSSVLEYLTKVLINAARSSSERFLPEKHWKNTILIKVDDSVGLLDFDKIDYLYEIGKYKV